MMGFFDAARARASERARASTANTHLRDRKVGRIDGLPPLAPRDADADVRGLDHPDVVRAVADRERDRWRREPPLDERDELARRARARTSARAVFS